MGKDSKKVTLGGKPKRNDHTLGPGPGGYNSESNNVRGSKSFRIGSEERKTKFGAHELGDKESLPGPGNYESDINKMGKDLKKITLGGKPKRDDSTLGPGPGGYSNEFSAVKDKALSARIGSEQRKTKFGDFNDKEQS